MNRIFCQCQLCKCPLFRCHQNRFPPIPSSSINIDCRKRMVSSISAFHYVFHYYEKNRKFFFNGTHDVWLKLDRVEILTKISLLTLSLLFSSRDCLAFHLGLFFILFSRLPFNWNTNPIGYFVALLFVLMTMSATLFCVVPFLCFIIGFTWITIAFVNQITENVHNLNKMNQNQSKSKTTNYDLMIDLFENVIQDISDMKQLSAARCEFMKNYYLSYISMNFITFFLNSS